MLCEPGTAVPHVAALVVTAAICGWGGAKVFRQVGPRFFEVLRLESEEEFVRRRGKSRRQAPDQRKQPDEGNDDRTQPDEKTLPPCAARRSCRHRHGRTRGKILATLLLVPVQPGAGDHGQRTEHVTGGAERESEYQPGDLQQYSQSQHTCPSQELARF